MNKLNLKFDSQKLTMVQMRNVVGGEGKPKCIYACDNGPGGVFDYCPDDGDDPAPCFEGGVVTDCNCFYNN